MIAIDAKKIVLVALLLLAGVGVLWWMLGGGDYDGGVRPTLRQLDDDRARVGRIGEQQRETQSRVERVRERVERGERIADDSARRIDTARGAIEDSRRIIETVRARETRGGASEEGVAAGRDGGGGVGSE